MIVGGSSQISVFPSCVSEECADITLLVKGGCYPAWEAPRYVVVHCANFTVNARDGLDLISKGRHERFVVGKEKFDAKLAAKRLQASRSSCNTAVAFAPHSA